MGMAAASPEPMTSIDSGPDWTRRATRTGDVGPDIGVHGSLRALRGHDELDPERPANGGNPHEFGERGGSFVHQDPELVNDNDQIRHGRARAGSKTSYAVRSGACRASNSSLRRTSARNETRVRSTSTVAQIREHPDAVREPGQRAQARAAFEIYEEEVDAVRRMAGGEAGGKSPQELRFAGARGPGNQEVRTVRLRDRGDTGPGTARPDRNRSKLRSRDRNGTSAGRYPRPRGEGHRPRLQRRRMAGGGTVGVLPAAVNPPAEAVEDRRRDQIRDELQGWRPGLTSDGLRRPRTMPADEPADAAGEAALAEHSMTRHPWAAARDRRAGPAAAAPAAGGRPASAGRGPEDEDPVVVSVAGTGVNSRGRGGVIGGERDPGQETRGQR